MTRRQVPLLRIAVGALALGALLAQLVVVPRVAAGFAGAYPEVARLAPPYVIAIVIAIGGFEVALLAAWRLLSAAEGGEAATSRSRLWADVMTASLGVMAVLFAGVCAHAGFVEGVGGPPMLFGLLSSLALVPGAILLRNKAMAFTLGDVHDRASVGAR